MYKSERFATAMRISRATKLTNTPCITNARHELARKHLARPIYVICLLDIVTWALYVRSAAVPAFLSFFLMVRLSHTKSTHDPRTENLLGLYFARASVMRQHSLLICGACCTNATHIFVRTVIAKGSCVCLKY